MIEFPEESAAAGRNRELLAEFVRLNDAPCAVCGYNLRNLTGEVCPECGQRFALKVGAPEARFGALVACLAPMLMMSGLLAFIIGMTARYGRPASGAWYWTFLVQGIVNAIAAVWLYRRRRAFLSMAYERQEVYAGISVSVNSAAFVLGILAR
ncbi:MAG: hypothetical protein FLDDKLPJ_02240 [Phycisphaerae bacterium]|nr:hypothetical protein [Phycisphaerae bacterium]